MPRVTNAEVTLAEWVNGILGMPYQWGETDCGTLVRQAWIILYDDDPFLGIVPRWTTKIGALRAYAVCGGMQQALELAGAQPVGRNFAQTSDVIVGRGESGGIRGYWAGVVLAGRVVTSVEDRGVVISPMGERDDVTIWRLA